MIVAGCLGSCTVLFALRSAPQPPATPTTQTAGAAEPWTAAQTVEPADLVKALAAPADKRPTVACVGFPSLYRTGHIRGASFHGPASSPEGLADLKAWAASLPRSSDIVLYCGCCPIAACPNLHPAFSALKDMGFTHVRVLSLPNNFGTDWVAQGYPVESR